MNHIPHSTFDDEARLIVLITKLIKDGELPKSKAWEKSVKDEKGKLFRKKQHEKEAKEAEELAKELGVWDEFYGSGKEGPRKSKAKGKGSQADGQEEDNSVLQAMILKRKRNMDGFIDNLAAKYTETEPKGKSKKGKKRAKEEDEEDDEQTSGKKPKPSHPDIDDAEFERLQQKLFGDKSKDNLKEKESNGKSTSKGKTKARKAK